MKPAKSDMDISNEQGVGDRQDISTGFDESLESMPKNNDSTDLDEKHLLSRCLFKLELTPPKGETSVMTEAKDTIAANEHTI